jgi:hypothetical protein
MNINDAETPQPASRTRIVFDLEDVLTPDELAEFQANAHAAGAPTLTEHLLNVTLRLPSTKEAA